MRRILAGIMFLLWFVASSFSDVTIISFSENGNVAWSNDTPAVNQYHVEWASGLDGTWTNSWYNLHRITPTGNVMAASVPMFYRIVARTNEVSGAYPIYWTNTGTNLFNGAGAILTLTEMLGPDGASVTRMAPGWYTARGTYDFTGSDYTNATIFLGFISANNYNYYSKVPFSIPPGQKSGNFEAQINIASSFMGIASPSVQFAVTNGVNTTWYEYLYIYVDE